ncbi:Cyclic nucleotide-binding domain [Arabidopsis thaliana x Arabidopsis arenosa]|uniref:Cyclic nucleotide-binding domain n=1 Tax=Arabidopsis thaliana x Arabidopsis arenosa TaxID=1240361 RepID=A0A8T2ESL9_9BRAS|nr:Cyclic nucleotide-binding domain [Arabidopsis thaliana x Arabidopsis arenosa]
MAHTRTFSSRNRSVSLSNPSFSIDGFDNSTVTLGYTGPLRTQRIRPPLVQMSGPIHSTRRTEPLFSPSPQESPDSSSTVDVPPEDDFVFKNANLLRSGQLGMCNDPYCTTCPSYYNRQAAQLHTSRVSASRFRTVLYGDARGWAKRFASSVRRCLPGIMNPHSKFVQVWTRVLAFSSLVAIFIDPLFFFLLLIQQDNKCIAIDWRATKVLVSLRSITDLIFFINILLQFRLAYVAPESRIVGAGQLVDHPRKIARHYFRGKFLLDMFIVFPIPQIMILRIIPLHLGTRREESEKQILRATVLFQYIPKLYRLLPLLAGQTSTGFIFESAWANFVINLLTFMLAGHAVGSCWYLSALQRVKKCMLNAWNISADERRNLIDCARGSYASKSQRDLWRDNASVNACFQENGYTYGIYLKAVNLTNESSFFTRFSYSLYWGFQQISTLAGNLSPSYSVGEVFFTMGIIGLGLLLFARLIGNMHNFLQSLDRRRMEMMLRKRDVEQWMSHRRLPEDIRKRVREVERYTWAATRGVNEELLFENMPDDLQRDIRRHLFKFLKKVRIFSLMDESVLDSIRERLKQRTYIRSSTVLHHRGLVEKMVFIVRGEMESIGEDGSVLPLSEGDVCGEELLTWCLSSINPDGTRIKMPPKGLVSNRNVRCVTNVEAFSLSVADLEDVTSLFSRFLRSHRVQGAIRYDSPYWRLRAARQIQVAWRYRRRRLHRLCTPQSSYSL